MDVKSITTAMLFLVSPLTQPQNYSARIQLSTEDNKVLTEITQVLLQKGTKINRVESNNAKDMSRTSDIYFLFLPEAYDGQDTHIRFVDQDNNGELSPNDFVEIGVNTPKTMLESKYARIGRINSPSYVFEEEYFQANPSHLRIILIHQQDDLIYDSIQEPRKSSNNESLLKDILQFEEGVHNNNIDFLKGVLEQYMHRKNYSKK